jgi:hypothetical protein
MKFIYTPVYSYCDPITKEVVLFAGQGYTKEGIELVVAQHMLTGIQVNLTFE